LLQDDFGDEKMDAGPAPAASSAPSPFDEDTLVPKKSLVDDARFDVTAMVDLVFMMNIFFLVTWAEMARAEIDLPTARHCTAAERDKSIVFTITAGAGTPAIYIGDGTGGGQLSPGQIDQKVTTATEEGVRDGKDIVLIKAEKDVLLRDVAHVATVATAVKGTRLMLAVIEKR
ncbi:MAG: biopolymer transporter ExbD, partial [Thermoguttaceae bacterium]